MGWRLSTRLPRDHCVRPDSNDDSAHSRVVDCRVRVAADLAEVVVPCDSTEVAWHSRCWADHQSSTDPARCGRSGPDAQSSPPVRGPPPIRALSTGPWLATTPGSVSLAATRRLPDDHRENDREGQRPQRRGQIAQLTRALKVPPLGQAERLPERPPGRILNDDVVFLGPLPRPARDREDAPSDRARDAACRTQPGRVNLATFPRFMSSATGRPGRRRSACS
ncbi:Mu transposase domain-containing protein [Amycolatopsis ultiminotia]|uniref:Mu transposase domain-containing protein n=1 Tax=Amycolatopsis ultiminotia TaxID=543629 RepID=UPI003CD08AFA